MDSKLHGIEISNIFSDSGKDSLTEFRDFVKKIVNKIKIFKWQKSYFNEHVIDGSEWRVTIHYKSGRTRNFFGVNSQPPNFDEFIKLWRSSVDDLFFNDGFIL